MELMPPDGVAEQYAIRAVLLIVRRERTSHRGLDIERREEFRTHPRRRHGKVSPLQLQIARGPGERRQASCKPGLAPDGRQVEQRVRTRAAEFTVDAVAVESDQDHVRSVRHRRRECQARRGDYAAAEHQRQRNHRQRGEKGDGIRKYAAIAVGTARGQTAARTLSGTISSSIAQSITSGAKSAVRTRRESGTSEITFDSVRNARKRGSHAAPASRPPMLLTGPARVSLASDPGTTSRRSSTQRHADSAWRHSIPVPL